MFVHYFICYCSRLLRVEQGKAVKCVCSWRHHCNYKGVRTSAREWTTTYWHSFGGGGDGEDVVELHEEHRSVSYK